MATKSLYEGLTTKAPPKDDASRRPPKGSVNDGATRTEPGYTGSAPGPRQA